MKRVPAFLVSVLALVTCAVIAAPVPSTVGDNLTAYNNNMGAVNNAQWNTYTNPRSNSALTGGGTTPTADFGNCNALILRCAQPKCANGGCSTMDIARPIVTGCVQSNETCSKYGTDLIEFISAQLVSDANAAAQAAQANAQIAAANAAAQQSNQQMQQMQQQMQQMQQQMQQQSADTAAQIQAALAQQQAATEQAIANATSANTAALNSVTAQMQQSRAQSAASTTATTATTGELTAAQQVAAQSGVSAELLAREQISGQILSEIENAEDSLKNAYAAFEDARTYAGCDSSGANCTGPKRVSTFKNKASAFFDPYNDVLNDVYDALLLAQSVGVDISNIYMMLSGTCSVWGQYLCGPGQPMTYTKITCPDGISMPVSENGTSVYGGQKCTPGQIVPESDNGCHMIRLLSNNDEIRSGWLWPENSEESGSQVRIGCVSDMLDNSPLFSNMRRQADIDIDTLRRMIDQDSPAVFGSNRFNENGTTPKEDGVIYCAVTPDTWDVLQNAASSGNLPDTVCVTDSQMKTLATKGGGVAGSGIGNYSDIRDPRDLCAGYNGNRIAYNKCLCEYAASGLASWDGTTCTCPDSRFNKWDWSQADCVDSEGYTMAAREWLDRYGSDKTGKSWKEDACTEINGAKWSGGVCDCSKVQDSGDKIACQELNKI